MIDEMAYNLGWPGVGYTFSKHGLCSNMAILGTVHDSRTSIFVIYI